MSLGYTPYGSRGVAQFKMTSNVPTDMAHNTTLHTDLDQRRLRQLQSAGLELRCFFDVGASNGVWARRVCPDFPYARFDLFEPLADIVPAYRAKLLETLAEHPRFHLHKIALGAECKRTQMHLVDEPSGSTALELPATPKGWTRVDVQMLTVDYAIEEFRLPVPQVIKMDTQGCELNILKGARRTLPQVQVLLVECWLARNYGPATPLFCETVQWLREMDFHLWDFGDPWRDEQGMLVTQDCFFLNAHCKASKLQQEVRPPPQPVPEALPPAEPPEGWLGRMRDFLLR